MSRVRAVFFDLDNTLWDVHPVIVRAEHAMYDFLHARYPAVTARHDLDSMRALRVQVARDNPDKRHDFTWLRLESLRRHARDAGYADAMAEQAFEVFFRTRNEVVLYDDVRSTLEILVRDYRLFAISNGNADLAVIGLAQYFEASLTAREAGMLKPDPRIFEILLGRAGLRAGETAHVGDDAEADVEGARRAGVLPIWLNREGVAWPLCSPAPRLVVAGLDELPDRLAAARAAGPAGL
jgi:putative hydrolase of the HAD superfamily